MKSFAIFSLLAVLVAFIACSKESEKTLSQGEVPSAVLQAFTSQYPDASVREYSSEREKGQTLYEISFTADNKAYDVTYNKDGQVVEVEEQITAEELPEAIKNELTKSFSKFQLNKVERIQEGGKIFYEAKLTAFEDSQKRAYEIKYSESGELIEKETGGEEGEE